MVLDTVRVTVEDLGELSLKQVKVNPRLSLLCTEVELSSLVDVWWFNEQDMQADT